MSRLSNVSQHYLLMDYYLIQFTWCGIKNNNREKIILKELNRRISMNEEFDNWEEVPDKDLWMDGELTRDDLMVRMFIKVIDEGNWRLIRRK